MRWWALLLLALAGAGKAAETVSICYNYGCEAEAEAVFADAQLQWAADMLGGAGDAAHERMRIALTVGQLYLWAGQQTPVAADRAGNYNDGGEHGAMDCIDHATTTTRFLRLLDARGWLHFHRVLPVQRRSRFLVAQHFSAAVEELGPVRDEDHPAPERYAVDSWFVDNGEPAVILPLEEWMEWGGPYVD
jgi:hypothetical protein